MSRDINNFQIIGSAMAISATSTQIVDIDMGELDRLILLFKITYAATNAVSNCSVTLSDGFGASDPLATGAIPIVVGGSAVPTFSSTGTAQTMNTVTGGSGSPQTVDTDVLIQVNLLPRWLRITILNKDPVNTATVSLLGEI